MRRAVPNKHELQVLEAFLIFNKFVTGFHQFHIPADRFSRHVLKTNFYQPTKVALSFRLAPGFLPEVEYPTKPFGLFIVIGEFYFLFMVMDCG
jgi:glutamate dehydrogenase